MEQKNNKQNKQQNNNNNNQKEKSPRRGIKQRPTCSHTWKSHKPTTLEAIIHMHRTGRVKREKKKYINKNKNKE